MPEKIILEKSKPAIEPIPVKSKPFVQIGMDIVGPLKETNTGSS